ncbi:MAG: hypothetical protein ACYCS0_00850 [bacterium]
MNDTESIKNIYVEMCLKKSYIYSSFGTDKNKKKKGGGVIYENKNT